MGKEKAKSGTISKVISDNFSKEELESLWKKHNQTLQELEEPTEKYTRYTSDLIITLRDVSEKLILAGAIPEATSQKDTASYVWKKLQERNIPYAKNNFYRYFSSEQKREWQTGDPNESLKQKHKHEFQFVGDIDGMGEVSRCCSPCIPACMAMMINGRLFEQAELEEKEPELKPQKPRTSYEEENEDFISAYEDAISRLKAVIAVWRTTPSNLTDEEKKELQKDLFHLTKSGEFLDMCYDRKNLIDPYTQHLLTMAYAEGTQKYAGGLFLMKRIDLAQRKHGEAVKYFKDSSQFAKLLSGKQTTKAMRGRIRNLNPRYEPQNEQQSQDAGFSGQQCSKCKSWRVGDDKQLNPNWKEGVNPVHEKFDSVLLCFHCGAVQKRKHFYLPKQTPLIVSTWDSAEMTNDEKDEYIKFKKNNGLNDDA